MLTGDGKKIILLIRNLRKNILYTSAVILGLLIIRSIHTQIMRLQQISYS